MPKSTVQRPKRSKCVSVKKLLRDGELLVCVCVCVCVCIFPFVISHNVLYSNISFQFEVL